MQQLSVWKGVERRQPILESLCIGSGLTRPVLSHQYAVLAHDREQFSGRRGRKFADQSIFKRDPLGVGPRKAEQPASLAQCRRELQCAWNLGFLTAQKIGRIEAVAAG